MMNIVVNLTISAKDEADFPSIVNEIRRRIETQPALQTDNIKLMLLRSIDKASPAGQNGPV